MVPGKISHVVSRIYLSWLLNCLRSLLASPPRILRPSRVYSAVSTGESKCFLHQRLRTFDDTKFGSCRRPFKMLQMQLCCVQVSVCLNVDTFGSVRACLT